MDKEQQDLYNASRHTKDAKEMEKIHLVSLVKYQKFSLTKASEMLMKSYNWGKECMQRYDEIGLNGLKTLPKTGRPLLLSKRKFKKIVHAIKQKNGSVNPKNAMYEVKRRTGIRYHITNIRKKLHSIKYVPKLPKRVHVNAASASTCYTDTQK